MKKLSSLIILLLSVFVFQTELTYAQSDDVFSFMEEYLTADESGQMDRARSSIAKADKLDSKIRSEDKKVEKYFKKKKKKGEKKSVAVKTLRIQQALYYDKAYVLVYNVYSDKIGESTFLFADDEARVSDLLGEAESDLASAKRKIKSFKGVTEKDLKKKIVYSKLKSDISSGIKLELSAINKLIEAYSIYLDQESKKQLEEEEKRVWDNASSENTALSYQSYLDEYPNGKFASSARQKVNSLEADEARIAQEERDRQRSLAGALVFEVQIAASRKAIPKWKLAKLYPAKEEIKMKNYDKWFKYSVGKFDSYDKAKAFKKTLRVRGAFVVAYKNDEKIDIKKAISGN